MEWVTVLSFAGVAEGNPGKVPVIWKKRCFE
jgi:hypothetical protein